MRNAQGYGLWVGPDGTKEADSFTCGHCNTVKFVRPKERPEDLGGLCKVCMRLVCGHCVQKLGCDVIEKKLERAEASYHARRSYGL